MTGVLPTERRGWPAVTNGVLLLFGVLMIQLCRDGVVEFHHFIHGFSEDLCAQLILFLLAAWLLRRYRTDKWSLRILLAVALLTRLVCVFAPAFLSTDLYRYVWDGKVQAEGINPYRYVPADSHLQALRDGSIYPHINRRDYAHTIYPPGAQMVFLTVTRVSATETFMKLAMVGFEAITCLVLLRILEMLHLPREQIVLYAWNPLCFWEIGSSGHVDAVALTFIALAFYARLKQRPGFVGAWLGAATLIKLYPFVLLPALFRRGEWRMIAVLSATVALGYACYASVGSAVVGFLPTYAQEEGIDSGGRYFLLTLARRTLHTSVPAFPYVVVCAAVLLCLSYVAFRRDSQQTAFIFWSLVIATAANLCFSPHYPWYLLWLLPALTIVPWLPALYLVVASTYLFATRLAMPGEPMYHLNMWLYGGFLCMLGYDLCLRWIERRKLHISGAHFSLATAKRTNFHPAPEPLAEARES